MPHKSFLLISALLAAQLPVPPAPPMKMGLWEQTMTNEPSAPSPSVDNRLILKTRACLTPETWTNAFHLPQGRCEQVHKSLKGDRFTMDISCRKTISHVEMKFHDSQTGHGTVTDSSLDVRPSGVQFIKVDMHFVSPNCWPVPASGFPQMVHQVWGN